MNRRNVPGTIYLLHFGEAYYRARHYLGWTEKPMEVRIEEHINGRASPLVRAVVGAGITVTLAATWEGVDRYEERRMKNRKQARAFCPLCKGE